MSWTIWSIARPSSAAPPAGLVLEDGDASGGRSPVRMSSAAWTVSGSPSTVSVAVSKESDSAPTVMPRPSIPRRDLVDALRRDALRGRRADVRVRLQRLRHGRDARGPASASTLRGDEALERVLVRRDCVNDLQAGGLAALAHRAASVAPRLRVDVDEDAPAGRGSPAALWSKRNPLSAVGGWTSRPGRCRDWPAASRRPARRRRGPARPSPRARPRSQGEHFLSWVSSNARGVWGAPAPY